MAVSPPPDQQPDDRLGCGRDVEDVWARIDQPPDAHEVGCPDCTDARRRLTRLAAATRRAREVDAQPSELPADGPSPGVKTAIMAMARAEGRRGRPLPLPGGDPADLTVSDQAVAAVIRRAADVVAGARVRRVHVRTAEPPVPGEIAVDLQVSVAYGTSVPLLLATVRSAVVDAVRREVGITTTAVDVLVADLHEDAA